MATRDALWPAPQQRRWLQRLALAQDLMHLQQSSVDDLYLQWQTGKTRYQNTRPWATHEQTTNDVSSFRRLAKLHPEWSRSSGGYLMADDHTIIGNIGNFDNEFDVNGLAKLERDDLLDAEVPRRIMLDINKIQRDDVGRNGSKHFQHALDAPLEIYDHIFVLRDDQERPYQKTVAEIVQMKAILESKPVECTFNPVVQVGNKTTGDQLLQCGSTNSVNTNLIMSRALAMVAMNKISHGVLTDLLSADGHTSTFSTCQATIATTRHYQRSSASLRLWPICQGPLSRFS